MKTFLFGIVFSIAFLVSLALSHFFMLLAEKFKLVDNPDGQLKFQKSPVPFTGGVVIALAITAVFIGAIMHFKNSFAEEWFFWSLAWLGFWILGFIDDFYRLSPKKIFLFQNIFLLFIYIPWIALNWSYLTIIDFLSLFFAFIWSLSIINAVNMIDVFDGLCTILVLVATLMLAIISYEYTLLSLFFITLSGALFGFFQVNKPSARMYLGNNGSHLLGAIFAALPIMLYQSFKGHGYSVFSSLFILTVLLGIFFAELVGLVIVRFFLKIPPWRGSRHHLCMFLINQGLFHGAILFFLAISQTLLATLAHFAFFGVLRLSELVILLIPASLCWITIIYWPVFSKGELNKL